MVPYNHHIGAQWFKVNDLYAHTHTSKPGTKAPQLQRLTSNSTHVQCTAMPFVCIERPWSSISSTNFDAHVITSFKQLCLWSIFFHSFYSMTSLNQSRSALVCILNNLHSSIVSYEIRFNKFKKTGVCLRWFLLHLSVFLPLSLSLLFSRTLSRTSTLNTEMMMSYHSKADTNLSAAADAKCNIKKKYSVYT